MIIKLIISGGYLEPFMLKDNKVKDGWEQVSTFDHINKKLAEVTGNLSKGFKNWFAVCATFRIKPLHVIG